MKIPQFKHLPKKTLNYKKISLTVNGVPNLWHMQNFTKYGS